jgi:hypothetical protein
MVNGKDLGEKGHTESIRESNADLRDVIPAISGIGDFVFVRSLILQLVGENG